MESSHFSFWCRTTFQLAKVKEQPRQSGIADKQGKRNPKESWSLGQGTGPAHLVGADRDKGIP